MNRTKVLAIAIVTLLWSIGVGSTVLAQTEEKSCEDWRCTFQQRLADECTCSNSTNHGRYVSCVAHVVKDLVDEGLPTNCKGKLKRCAARSVCGKQERGFVTCSFVEYGTCATGDTLTGPTCAHDPALTCTSDTDCIVSSSCRIRSSAERCEASGGAVNEAPTCCSSCSVAPTP